jgi:hypothetical protein
MTDPRDWYRPTTDNGEPAYLITREGVVLLAMGTDGNVAMDARVEIANIVTAWYRGEIFPRRAAPTIAHILDFESEEGIGYEPEPPAPAPIEIAGGAAGLQRLWISMAEKKRGLNPAALKDIFNAHQIVVAVWEGEGALSGTPPGYGFLTLKGFKLALAQLKRGAKKAAATMTAVWCNSKEHAELLQQALGEKDLPQ